MAVALAVSVRSAVLGSGRPKRVTMLPTSRSHSGKMHNTQHTPKVLMMVCDTAVRLAAVLPTEAAMLAAMVVPMFSPRIMVAASRNGITPVVIRIMMMAIVAAELWKQMVRMMPISRKIRMLQPPRSVQACTKPRLSGVMSSCAEALSWANPMKNRAKPMISSPMSRHWRDIFFVCIMM